ncbi:hypothetical protein LCGC14_0867150 [marine sediment metagenome]|uniref:VRR-NUC domain-containing protein n=1 Tax=marine sediment metagenome TaxID=412755 RepID=A0A0F9P5P3_9ZZZZ
MSEAAIVREIIKQLKKGGGDGYHVHGSALQRRGEPDIDGSYPSSNGKWLHLKIEVKTATGAATSLQLYRLEEYRKRGYITGVVRSWIDVLALIREANRKWQK